MDSETFIRDNACNPVYWLNALDVAVHCTDCDSKRKVLQNSHDKLKLYIEFLEQQITKRDKVIIDMYLESRNNTST